MIYYYNKVKVWLKKWICFNLVENVYLKNPKYGQTIPGNREKRYFNNIKLLIDNQYFLLRHMIQMV